MTKLPPLALDQVKRALAEGDAKHNGSGTRYDGGAARHLAGMFRHLARWIAGEKVDPDSGAHPLAHAIARLLIVLEIEIVDAAIQAAEGDE